MNETHDQKLIEAVNALTDEVRLSREATEKAHKFQEQLLIRLAPELEKSNLILMQTEAHNKRLESIKGLSSRPKH